MKRIILNFAIILLGFALANSFAQENKPATPAKKIILLIAEQNIEGPQRAWWASEVDLSTVEANIARKLIESGFEIAEPSLVTKELKQSPAFKTVDLSETKSVELGSISKADYVVLGKAIASAGGNIPQSSMRSCFANVTVKVIRIKDGQVIAYLDSAGSSAHLDVISGGREALAKAGEGLATKIIEAINKVGGK
ncbi:MAG TPA: hypothetical protein VMD04_01675 [Candidatus Margulisiibacteriota bacterium]|nr:hypothetical protein [Candidatus Margulisiibacteriota bacterium]